MANELNIALAKSGLTVTAQCYQSGSAVGSAISLTEVGSSGFYSGNMTGAAGTYQLVFISAGANVGSGSIVWSGTAEVPASTFNPTTDTVANVTLCATTTTLTNAPSVPSASAIASQVRTELSVELARVDTSISSRLASASYQAPTTPPSAATIAAAVWAAADKTGYSLTSAERSAIATAVESSLLNESDGQQILNAIVGAIGNQNIDQVALVAAIRSDLERAGGKLINLDTTVSSRLAGSSYATPPTAAQVRAEIDTNSTQLAAIKSKTDPLNSDRLSQCATTAIVGALISQANS